MGWGSGFGGECGEFAFELIGEGAFAGEVAEAADAEREAHVLGGTKPEEVGGAGVGEVDAEGGGLADSADEGEEEAWGLRGEVGSLEQGEPGGGGGTGEGGVEVSGLAGDDACEAGGVVGCEVGWNEWTSAVVGRAGGCDGESHGEGRRCRDCRTNPERFAVE